MDQRPPFGAGIRLVLDKKSRPAGDRAALENVLADAITNNANHPNPQPATVHQLRALRLIGTHHVRPELAMTLATLAFGGGRSNG